MIPKGTSIQHKRWEEISWEMSGKIELFFRSVFRHFFMQNQLYWLWCRINVVEGEERRRSRIQCHKDLLIPGTSAFWVTFLQSSLCVWKFKAIMQHRKKGIFLLSRFFFSRPIHDRLRKLRDVKKGEKRPCYIRKKVVSRSMDYKYQFL